MTINPTVIIAGGGAAGSLVAAHLLRNSEDVRVVLLEPRAEPGRGMAYSTTCPAHLLNVPAAKMSAFPDDPRHFLRWLHSRGLTSYSETSFVPRMIFGDYLHATLDDAIQSVPKRRFQHLRTRANGFSMRGSAVHVKLESGATLGGETLEGQTPEGQTLEGDALVLALGNAAPAPWPHLDPQVAASGRFFSSAWESGALQPADPNESVLLIGTGLTAIDAVLALRSSGHRGPISMVSRRGLIPQAHRLFDCTPMPCTPSATALGLFRNMRATARDAEMLYGNWRIAVDGVRPETNRLWQGLPLVEQRRFLRHLRAPWDVHRHRMAPEIAATVHDLIAHGTLRILAGRPLKFEVTEHGLQVQIKLRGQPLDTSLSVGRVINCTGPEANLERLPNPLVQDMLRQGYVLPHPLRSGALVNNDGALVGRTGEPSACLFTLGPLCTGTLIETVAMPEIRRQAFDLALRLAGNPVGEPAFHPARVA